MNSEDDYSTDNDKYERFQKFFDNSTSTFCLELNDSPTILENNFNHKHKPKHNKWLSKNNRISVLKSDNSTSNVQASPVINKSTSNLNLKHELNQNALTEKIHTNSPRKHNFGLAINRRQSSSIAEDNQTTLDTRYSYNQAIDFTDYLKDCKPKRTVFDFDCETNEYCS